ncbi:hypothetical protein KZ843_32230 [Pseudomonas aeruginosa]|nr:hypothetical protein [Pseudomonas aeruginosa]MBW6127528.1 hypothetical protein [Pseudomonas aeruginosa]
MKEISSELEEIFQTIRKGIEQEIEAKFKAGKASEKERTRSQRKDNVPSGFGGVLRAMLGAPDRQREGFGFEFDESHPLIAFNNQEEAVALVKNIEKGVADVISDGEKVMTVDLEALLRKFRESFSRDIKGEAEKLVNALNKRFNQEGFSIDIRLPDPAPLSFPYTASELLGEIVDSRTRSVTRYRRSTSVWGKLCGLFDSSDWGWESYQSSEGYYEVNIHKVRKQINNSVNKIFSDLRETTDTTIKAPLEAGVRQFFEQLKLTLENIRSDLAQSLVDKQSSRGEQQALAQRLSGLKRNVPGVRKDSEELKNDVQPTVKEVVA